MSTQKTLADDDVVASTLRALGVAIFAGLAGLLGVVLKWLILRDETFSGTNLELANFLIALGALVAAGSLFMVALGLVKWPERRPGNRDSSG